MESKNIPKVKGLIAEFRSIKNIAMELRAKIKDEIEIKGTREYIYTKYFKEVDSIKESYLKAKDELEDLVPDISLDTIGEDLDILTISLRVMEHPSILLGTLNKIIVNCDKALGVLSALITSISPEEQDKLSSLRKQIEQLEIDYPEVHRYLKEAIDEYENGHYIASTLIASKVACYALEQIPGIK